MKVLVAVNSNKKEEKGALILLSLTSLLDIIVMLITRNWSQIIYIRKRQ